MKKHTIANSSFLLIKLVFFTTISYSASAQDGTPCNCNNLIVLSASGTFNGTGWMTTQAKLGVWRNVHSGGLTVGFGYESSNHYLKVNKSERVENFRSFVAEIGYKQSLSGYLAAHVYVSTNRDYQYSGAELLYNTGNTVLIGAKYENNRAGVSVKLRLN